MAIYNNLTVNYDGTIFQYSKDEKEGYEKFTNSNNKVSYRKYFKYGVSGIFTGIKKENNKYLNNAEEVRLTLKDGEELNILSFTVLNQSADQLDDYAQSLALILPKMIVGEPYTINNWIMRKGDDVNGSIVQYGKKGLTVKNALNATKDDINLVSDITFEYVKGRGTAAEEHVKGDVPMLEWKQIAGKNRPTAGSKEAQLEFLYGVLDKEIARVNNATPAQKQETAPKANDMPDTGGKEPDDLPF